MNDIQEKFSDACKNGHTEVVKLLLSDDRVDPSVYDNRAIRFASVNGQTEVVKLLLSDERVDPSDYNNYAIKWASENGHTEIVKLLLSDERVDPSAWDNHAIKWASKNGHTEIVNLLQEHAEKGSKKMNDTSRQIIDYLYIKLINIMIANGVQIKGDISKVYTEYIDSNWSKVRELIEMERQCQ